MQWILLIFIILLGGLGIGLLGVALLTLLGWDPFSHHRHAERRPRP